MYSFVVFIHVLSVLVFLLAHGVSIIVFFLIRRQPSVERVHILKLAFAQIQANLKAHIEQQQSMANEQLDWRAARP